MYVSPFLVRRDRMHREIRKKIGQKSGKLSNESEMKFYLRYNSICKN